MAAAARPGPADARIPCPLCGGLIHPIAGRCKHCKGDLRTLRSTRPAAAATLPSLTQGAPAARLADGPTSQSNGHAAHAAAAGHGHAEAPRGPSLVQAVAGAGPIPLAIHAGAAGEAAAPILPPRPTGRYPAAAPPRSAWRSWPVIVILLAMAAIVTAVILMVFPPSTGKDSGKAAPPPPAPDRMNTDPTPTTPTPRQPPSTNPDPWSRGSRGGPTAPPPGPPTVAPDVDIDDPDLSPPTGRDPFARRGGSFAMNPGMVGAIIKHACDRLASCGSSAGASGAKGAQLQQVCDAYRAMPADPPPTCPAAARCLEAVDEMSCDAQLDPMKLFQLTTKLADCSQAMSC